MYCLERNMTKRQLIDEIISINRTAQPSFLARFNEIDLDEYLRHLIGAKTSRLSGDYSRYRKYFQTDGTERGCATNDAANRSQPAASPALGAYQAEAVSPQADDADFEPASFDCEQDEAAAPVGSVGEDTHDRAHALVPAGSGNLPAYNISATPFAESGEGKWLF